MEHDQRETVRNEEFREFGREKKKARKTSRPA